jgi:hypothetical protein
LAGPSAGGENRLGVAPLALVVEPRDGHLVAGLDAGKLEAEQGLADTAVPRPPSITGRPLMLRVTEVMKWAGTACPPASRRWPDSMGWGSSTRTSPSLPLTVARILMGSDMGLSLLAAAADGDLDLAEHRVVLATGAGDDAQAGAFAHLEPGLEACHGRGAKLNCRARGKGFLSTSTDRRVVPGMLLITSIGTAAPFSAISGP